MIRAQVIGAEAVIQRLNEVPPRVLGFVRQAVEAEAINLVRDVKENKLTGQVLKTQTGRLRRSINYALSIEDQGLTATVGTNLVYAGIHEYGSQTRAHVIQARNAKALAFQVGGQTIIRKSVNHPGSKMPERSFLRSSLRENEARIKANIAAAVSRGIQK
ncbi:MAG: HK97 gp10 family phage protein [Deltaproteobacteria bacterium]|nr:HK97 gp10 family phage protein [Deltaproteobacteria bacterium]